MKLRLVSLLLFSTVSLAFAEETPRLSPLVRYTPLGVVAEIRDPEAARLLFEAIHVAERVEDSGVRKALRLGNGRQFLVVECVAGRSASCRVSYRDVTVHSREEYFPRPGMNWSRFPLDGFLRARFDQVFVTREELIWDLQNLTQWSTKSFREIQDGSGVDLICRKLVVSDNPVRTLPESLECSVGFMSAERPSR